MKVLEADFGAKMSDFGSGRSDFGSMRLAFGLDRPDMGSGGLTGILKGLH